MAESQAQSRNRVPEIPKGHRWSRVAVSVRCPFGWGTGGASAFQGVPGPDAEPAVFGVGRFEAAAEEAGALGEAGEAVAS